MVKFENFPVKNPFAYKEYLAREYGANSLEFSAGMKINVFIPTEIH